MIIPLSKPFKYEDFDLTEIVLDFDKITPGLILSVNRQMRNKKIIVPFPKMEPEYQLAVASRITGIPEEVLMALPYEDWDAMTSAVYYFLLNSREPETEIPEETLREMETSKKPSG